MYSHILDFIRGHLFTLPTLAKFALGMMILAILMGQKARQSPWSAPSRLRYHQRASCDASASCERCGLALHRIVFVRN
jgi:hypothetical protein